MAQKKSIKEKPFQSKEWLKNNYGEGKGRMTAGEISRKFGVTRTAVLHYIKKYKIPITTRRALSKNAKKDFQNPEWLKRAIESGRSIYSIAQEQKTTYGTIASRVSKLALSDAAPAPKKPAAKKPAKK